MKSFVAFTSVLACALAYVPAPAYYGSQVFTPAQISVLSNGFLADTPEVAHAKGIHQAAQAQASAAAAANPDYTSSDYSKSSYDGSVHSGAYVSKSYPQIPAKITVLSNGHLADTPEVAHAKGIHHAALVKASAAAAAHPDHSGSDYSSYDASVHSGSYSSPHVNTYAHIPAKITVLSNGHLADTPEVAHAKGVHHAALAQASAAAGSHSNYNNDDSGAYNIHEFHY